MRSHDEIIWMVKIIGNIKFFKEAKELTLNHMREICKNLEVMHSKIGENVVVFEEPGEHFFVILSGQVGVYIPNPLIKNWRSKHQEYTKLRDWKKDYDKRLLLLKSKSKHPDIIDEEIERIIERHEESMDELSVCLEEEEDDLDKKVRRASVILNY